MPNGSPARTTNGPIRKTPRFSQRVSVHHSVSPRPRTRTTRLAWCPGSAEKSRTSSHSLPRRPVLVSTIRSAKVCPTSARTFRGSRRTTTPRRLNRLHRSEEHTSELQSRQYLVCRLLLEKKNCNLYPTSDEIR